MCKEVDEEKEQDREEITIWNYNKLDIRDNYQTTSESSNHFFQKNISSDIETKFLDILFVKE